MTVPRLIGAARIGYNVMNFLCLGCARGIAFRFRADILVYDVNGGDGC